MTEFHPDSPDEIMQGGRERRDRFDAWLEQLRSGDPRFAQVSALRPHESAGWQAATYLLTGCDAVWRQYGGRVLADRSLDCVAGALDEGGPWDVSQTAVLRWAAHFWDARANDCGGFPCFPEEYCFRRWVTAGHLRQQIAPALTIIDERRGGDQ